MKKMREFDDILNKCIERVLKGESVEACLAAFPEHAAELEPLLRTAVDTHKAAGILPRPEFRQQAGYEFQLAIRDMKPKRNGFLQWHLRWVTAISVVVVLLMAGSGTVVSSANSLPDEPLYQVKLFTEDVRLNLMPSTLGKAELYTEFTDTRVNEIIKMADKGKVEQVEKTTERMNANLIAIAKLIQPAKQGDTAAEGTPKALLAAPGDTAISTPTPAQANTVANATATALKTAPVPVTEPARSVTSNMSKPGVTEKTDGKSKTNEKKEITTTVSRQAEKNARDLKEALERVPDSVKPSVEKAIEVAGKGYDEALKDKEQKKK
jgi:hypothetical protein